MAKNLFTPPKRVSELPLRKKINFYLAVWFGWILIFLLGRSYKIKVEGEQVFQELKRKKQPFIVAIWHGRFFVGVYFFRFWRLVAMVSQHLDGEMISRTIHKLGYGTIRGSSTRGGKEAFHQMVDFLKKGGDGAMIPDGPTGPRHRLKSGVIYMAHQARVPIVPFTFSSKPAMVFNSWDRFMVPKPFARVLIKIGRPIWPNPNANERELVELKNRVESDMIKLEQEADAFFAT